MGHLSTNVPLFVLLNEHERDLQWTLFTFSRCIPHYLSLVLLILILGVSVEVSKPVLV